MTMFTFTVPGKIKGKARPRVLKSGFTYTPKETVQYENWIKMCYREAQGEHHEQAVQVTIDAQFDRPKSHYRTGKNSDLLRDDAPHWHTARPDGDNIAKCVCDSLNGLAWKDDSLVSKLSINKSYSSDHQERLVVYIDVLTWFDC